MTDTAADRPGGDSAYKGPERRSADTPDRRQAPRGGRRVGDTFKKLAGFVYRLLTEPPR
jgi:hypothetical protein